MVKKQTQRNIVLGLILIAAVFLITQGGLFAIGVSPLVTGASATLVSE